MASSHLIRWSVAAATAGGVLFYAVDPAIVGTFAGQQTLRALGTVLLSGGSLVFLVGFVVAGFLAGLDRERRAAALASFALGGCCLLALPIYYLIFTGTVRVFGGGSPMCLLLSLVLVPLLVCKGTSRALFAATLVSVFAAVVQVLAAFLALYVVDTNLRKPTSVTPKGPMKRGSANNRACPGEPSAPPSETLGQPHTRVTLPNKIVKPRGPISHLE